MKKLHPPQEAHVQRLLKVLAVENSAADLSPCGLGKTVCNAEVARLLKRPLFVVAPLSTLPAWREELDERGVSAVVTNYEQLRSKKNGWAVKDKMGRWSWTLDPNTVVIFDEAQKLKTPDSITSRIAIAARPYTTLMLSGSLAESPVHMRASGYLLRLHDLRSFGRWAKERGCTVNQWGKLVFNDNEKILGQLHRDIMPAHGSQMTFAEMKAFMPNNQVIFEAVDFGDKGAISHFYDEMEVELAALEEIVENDRKGAEALTMQLRARQKVELLKIPLLAERAAALAAEGSSVIVFLTYAASIDALSERLGGVPIIDGRHGDREAVRQAFCKDQTHIIAVNVAAGGAGISLHGKRPRRTILTPDYNPISIAQALGRAPRVGGGDVIQWVLTARGTVEDAVTLSLKQKLRNISLVNTGDICDAPGCSEIDKAAFAKSRQDRKNAAPNVASLNFSPTSTETGAFATDEATTANPATAPMPGPDEAPSGHERQSCALNTVLHSPSMTSCSKHNEGGVLSATSRSPEGTPPVAPLSPLTTATKPEKPEGYFAATATFSSADSETAPSSFGAQSNISKNMPSEHAQFSPSALASLERCPGWRSTGGTNPAAERGTMIHAALEKDTLHTLEDEDRNQAMLCRDFIDGYLADRLPAQPETDLREVRLTMQLGNGRESFGTCDRLIIFGQEAALFDFKMGRLSVDDAETNPQGEAYATGVLQQYPQVENVTVHFLQPARDWVSFHTFTRADLPRMILRHSTIIARAEANNPAQYAPAPSLCEWCAQQATCPALASKALLLSTKFASGLPLPENPVVSTERPEDIPHLLRLAPLMEAWARGVRAAALQASLEDGLEIDGFRRYERSTGRAVNSVIGAYEAVKDVLSLDEFLTACGTVSVPDLEEVFAERARQDATKKRGKVGAARQDLENRLRDADVLKEPGTIFFLREKKA